MSDNHKTETDYANGTLKVTRTFKAPIEDVFDAWIEVNKVKEWWGCAQTVKVDSTIEPKVGGTYTHHMTLDNGFEVPGDSKFFIYEPPTRLGYEMEDEERGLTVQVTVEFEAREGGTFVTLTHINIRDEFAEFVRGGWGAAFGKLAKFVESAEAA
jgi:uncharacterized protein YndB with AHSA1/START domain